MEGPPESFTMRRAAAGDAATIADHRAQMFHDMGQLPSTLVESFRAKSERWTANAIESGEYLGWLALDGSSRTIAGAGVQLRRVAPHPLPIAGGEVEVAEGRHAIIINVFTEPEWRRRGLAARLIGEILACARVEQIDRLLLRASAKGRALYESLGFVQDQRDALRRALGEPRCKIMKRFRYHLLDVFTDRAFGGNPLAVFPDGRGIPEATMPLIAKEFNLSETTFVFPPDDPANNYRVRIFTPTIELPMAGHPTIGTTFVLAREGMIERGVDETSITLEEGVGPIPVSIEWKDGVADFIEMGQPLPEFGPRFYDVDAIAEMLSIDPDKIRATNLPIEVVSCGVPYLLVPISDLATTRSIRVRPDVLDRVLKDFPVKDIFVFTQEVEFAGSRVHTRMFAPAFGVPEDPATGSANGPLGCYLVRYGVLSSDGEKRFVSEQGIEMARPSFLHIGITHRGSEITAVKVGGRCYYMGSGEIELAD